jgi:hypothetical protein
MKTLFKDSIRITFFSTESLEMVCIRGKSSIKLPTSRKTGLLLFIVEEFSVTLSYQWWESATNMAVDTIL